MNFDLIEKLLFIRRLEEAIAQRYVEQKMRCPTHLSIGQELPAVAVCEAMSASDLAVSTHRGHAHYLAKGGDPYAFVAELYGKSTGCSGGLGGSMHLIDEEVGFYGTTAIVGNSIPVGVGLACSLQLDNNKNNLSTIFIGEAATETGVFYESANFATVNNLPVVFACENNLYSVYSDQTSRQPTNRTFLDLARGLGLNYYKIDTFDTYKCIEETAEIINKARGQNQPIFLEFPTYRHLEHCGPNYDDDLDYREKNEIDFWFSKDPLNRELTFLKENGHSQKLNVIEDFIGSKINKIFNYAENSNFADFKDLREFV